MFVFGCLLVCAFALLMRGLFVGVLVSAFARLLACLVCLRCLCIACLLVR